jgi:hypothetical protein
MRFRGELLDAGGDPLSLGGTTQSGSRGMDGP